MGCFVIIWCLEPWEKVARAGPSLPIMSITSSRVESAANTTEFIATKGSDPHRTDSRKGRQFEQNAHGNVLLSADLRLERLERRLQVVSGKKK